MNKYKTNIPGLDTLFHGGIQIDNSLDDNTKRVDTSTGCKNKDNGLVIVIKGEKGTYKTNLTMQMMYGFYRSLNDGKDTVNKHIKALFYSVNKNSDALNDSFLDMIIAQVIKDIVRQYRKDCFLNNSSDKERKDRFIAIQALLEFIFDLDNSNSDNVTRMLTGCQNIDLRSKLPKFLCEGIVIYNGRTNALHYKREKPGDDLNNLVATRKHDTILEYIFDYLDDSNKGLHSLRYEIVQDFLNNLLAVSFNSGLTIGEEMDIPRSPKTIFKEIESDIFQKNFGNECDCPGMGKDEKFNHRENSNEKKYDILVVDGFSQLGNQDLENMGFSNFRDLVSRLAKISILVFDERESARCDGDIVIDMRVTNAENEEYMYHELQITKSVFQTSVLGWHQFKKRDEGIEVFPSTHLLLSKRHYIANKSQRIGQSLYESSFDQYLEALRYQDCKDQAHKKHSDNCYAFKTAYADYMAHAVNREEDLMRRAFEEYAKNIEAIKTDDIDSLADARKLLSDILYLNKVHPEKPFCWKNECGKKDYREIDWTDHFPSTAIIGNPNSYKRTLALATSYRLAQQGIPTLFFLFDKNEMDMRKMMVCPACSSKRCDNRLVECLKCTKSIHTYDLRMGCISAEEFYSILLDQIEFYCKPDKNTGIETSCLHIVIDDIQKIDFSFPFLRSNELFLSALVAICQTHKVKLTILCDKSASLMHEVCSLVDNVIDIRRNIDDIYNIELNVERGFNTQVPSRIIQFKIKDILHLFSCDGHEMKISDVEAKKGNILEANLIGSVKEYWRKTVNTIDKT